MAPLRPEASRATSSRDVLGEEEHLQVTQAGRSATTLNAAASAHSLRQQEQQRRAEHQQNVRPSGSAPNLLRKKNKNAPQSRLQDIGDTSDNEHPNAERAANFSRPATLSALQAGTSSANSNNSGESSGQNSRLLSADSSPEARPRDALLPGTKVPRMLPIPVGDVPPLTRPTTGRSEMSKRNSQLSLNNRMSTPRSVRDLGTDYDRYYNPFASRNNSQLDLSSVNASTHLLIPGSASAADLNRRYSNPFADSKQESAAIHSNTSTRPASPVHDTDHRLGKSPLAEVVAMSSTATAATGTSGTATKPGTPTFIRDADPEKTPFYPYIDDRLGNPEYAFPLFVDTKEDDDDMHMPAWDDDIKMKPKLRDHFTRENVVSTLGMLLMLCGLICIFIVLPIVSYTTTGLIPYQSHTPLDQMPGVFRPVDKNSWQYVNDKTYPLMSNIKLDLIDPDTPDSAKQRYDVHGNHMQLVFSDEFNEQNRTFYEGDDPFWFGFDGWYGATQDLEWYDPDAINTGDGTLRLQLDAFKNHGLDYRSGMLNSWNHLCFKGGVFEISASLPGPAGVHGFWPGAWTMGNLGRPGYLSTTDGMWPYTYDDCDVGITPNQSMTDGTSKLPGQRLNKCTCAAEDHPTPGTGRGAPEIDIIEVSADWGGKGIGVATQSYQVAPFDIWYYPDYDFMETPEYNLSFVNTYTGGPFQEAVSTTTMLNNDWYDGKAFQKYAFEYAPGKDENAYIQWFVGDNEMMKFDARAIGPNGNIGQRLISEEPMHMILNLGFSHSWVNIDFSKLSFPTVMQIDYVRWYQKDDSYLVTCDPPGYETTQYIADHPVAYNNPNITEWKDTPYPWPKNTLMHGCEVSAAQR